MIKRSAAVAAVLGALCAGVIAVAPGASADTVWSCRSQEVNSSGHQLGWVGEPGGVTLDSCWQFDSNITDDVHAEIGISTQSMGIDPCAQLVDVATGQWVHNYGCAGWKPSYQGEVYYDMDPVMDLPVQYGHTYVVQVGYWADLGNGLKYYGNVQSPQLHF